MRDNDEIIFFINKGYSRAFFESNNFSVSPAKGWEIKNLRFSPFQILKELMLSKYELATELNTDFFESFYVEAISFDEEENIDEINIKELYFYENVPSKLKEKFEQEIENYENTKDRDPEKFKPVIQELFRYFLNTNISPFRNEEELLKYTGVVSNLLENHAEAENLLKITSDENFAIPKYIYYSLLVKEKPIHLPLTELKQKLLYVKDYDNSHLKDNPDAQIEDLYKMPEEILFRHYFSNLVKNEIEICKNRFKDELFTVEDEYVYFDKVVSSLLEDYKHLEQLLYKDTTDFLPVIREFRLQYSSLLKWVISELGLYLTKELKRDIEKIITPRDYIKTFTIKNKSLSINTYVDVVQELRKLEYLDENTKGNDLKKLFVGKENPQKIYWNKGIGTLYTFIYFLKEEGIIESENIWEIGSRYFLVKKKQISTKQLRDSKVSKETTVRDTLKKIALKLK